MPLRVVCFTMGKVLTPAAILSIVSLPDRSLVLPLPPSLVTIDAMRKHHGTE